MQKRGRFLIRPGLPIEFDEEVADSPLPLESPNKEWLPRVKETVATYLRTVETLLSGRLSQQRAYAPPHLISPPNAFVACCTDGIVIRYERKSTDQQRVVTADIPESLCDLVPLLSENVVYCHKSADFKSRIPETGAEFRMEKVDPSGGSETVLSMRLGIDAVLQLPPTPPAPPRKPFCVVSACNEFIFQTMGELVKEGEPLGTGQPMLTHTTIRLNVGWEGIEVYPFVSQDAWRPDCAELWAENDLMAAILAKQFQEIQLSSLDPRASARREYYRILGEYESLLASNPEREETFQTFLKTYPFLLCPSLVEKWPKLQLGAKVTDFVFRDGTGDYTLVELERPNLPLFTKSGDLSQWVNHAHGQITDWKRYLEDNLSTVQRELSLPGITANPKAILVIGRASTLTDENIRKLRAVESQSPKLKIMTYDDVLLNAKAMGENIFGPAEIVGSNTRVFYLPSPR